MQTYNKSELNMTSVQSKYAQVINPTLLVNKLSTFSETREVVNMILVLILSFLQMSESDFFNRYCQE